MKNKARAVLDTFWYAVRMSSLRDGEEVFEWIASPCLPPCSEDGKCMAFGTEEEAREFVGRMNGLSGK